MVRNHCGHMVDPSWARCGECGALVEVSQQMLSQTNPNPSQPALSPRPAVNPLPPKNVAQGVEMVPNMNCPHMVNPAWSRCQECGVPVQIKPEDPDALAELENLAKQFLDDGVLEDWEYDFLKQERQRLGLRESSLNTIIQSYQPLQQANAGLNFDRNSIEGFVAGHPCQFLMQLGNLDKQPFKSLDVYYRTSSDGELNAQHINVPIPPNVKKNFMLPFEPQESGQYALQGVLKITSFRRELFCYRFEGIMFYVVPEQTGPSNVTYNIDNSLHQNTGKYGSTAMQGNVNIAQAKGPTSGAFTKAAWQEVSLKPISEEALAEFLIPKAKKGTFVIPPQFKNVAGMTKLKLTLNNTHEVLLNSGSSLALGRHPARSDQQVLFEPCLPQASYPQNFQKTMDISSRHCTISIQGSSPYILDQSTNGTNLNGSALRKGDTVPLPQGCDITIAGSLRLGGEYAHDAKGQLGYVLLKRKNNMPNKSHLLLNTAIGLWPQRPGWLGEPVGAPALLSIINGLVCICNVSSEMMMGTTALKKGHAAPLNANSIVIVDGKLVMVGTF